MTISNGVLVLVKIGDIVGLDDTKKTVLGDGVQASPVLQSEMMWVQTLLLGDIFF